MSRVDFSNRVDENAQVIKANSATATSITVNPMGVGHLGRVTAAEQAGANEDGSFIETVTWNLPAVGNANIGAEFTIVRTAKVSAQTFDVQPPNGAKVNFRGKDGGAASVNNKGLSLKCVYGDYLTIKRVGSEWEVTASAGSWVREP